MKWHTFKIVLHKSHWVIWLACTHCLYSWAEAGDGQNNDIANLFRRLHAGEVFPGDVALAGAHVKVVGVVEEGKDAVGPHGWACKLNDAAVVLGKGTGLLALQRLLCDICYDVDENRVAGLRLDGPLAELDAARVPFSPVCSVGVGLDANDHAVGVGRDVVGDPVCGALQG